MTSNKPPQDSKSTQFDADGSNFRPFPPFPSGFYKNGPHRWVQLDMDLLDNHKSNFMGLDDSYLLPVAWAVVLARYTESNEVLFGLAYRGRKTDMGDQAISPFLLRVSPNDTLAETMDAAAQYDGEMRHSEYMGLAMFGKLNPTNMVLCKFRTLLVIGEELHDKRAELDQEQYPLSLYAYRTGIQACFDPLLLSSDVLRSLLTQVADVLQAAIERPNPTILDVQTVGRRGLAQMQNFHASHKMCAYQLINLKLLSHPSALAVSAWDGNLTYGELDRWASCMSRHIVSHEIGVQPGQFVGILMSKSVTSIVAMLSVIKAGAAFVFLMPSLPSERLRIMCRAAGVKLILTTTSHKDKAAELGIPAIQMSPRPNPTEEVELFDNNVLFGPLYAVFTSGSTGEPKGVQVDRESFGPGLMNWCARTRLGPDSRIFQSVSYAFVVSIFEQLAALSIGACICIPSDEQLENNMESTMAQFKADWAIIIPTVARTLNPSQLPALKTLLLAGEPVIVADVKQWENSTTLFSAYGQSETATTLLLRQMNGSSLQTGNIGTSTTGRCWVVDQDNHHRLSAVGTDGELLIESTAVATCYLGDPAQSAKVFVERPAWSPPVNGYQPRWLLTGDLARYDHSDGSIQIVSRKGTRTKIRGQRIELGEVESCLRLSLPSIEHIIAEVVTPAAGDWSGQSDPLLIAFISAGSKTTSSAVEIEVESTSEIRADNLKALAALRQLLPTYMVPSAILKLRHMPQTASGKINRKALRDWAADQPVDELLTIEERAPYRPAEIPQELVVQSVCEKILHLPSSKIGLEDNFFHLGGNSLTARQLVSACHLRGFHVTASNVFNEPTLAALAKCLAKSDLQSTTGHVDEDPFVSFKEELLQTMPPGLDADNMEDAFPALKLQTHLIEQAVFDYFPVEIHGEVDVDRLRRSCQILVNAQPALRSIFIPFKDQLTQIVLRHAAVNLVEVTAPSDADLMSWVRTWVIQDRQQPPPPGQFTVGFTLVHHDSNKSAFVIRLSHAQYDGVCCGPLLQQIETIFSDPEIASRWRPEADFTSYRRVCARQRTPQAFEYWSGILQGSEVTKLPQLPQLPNAEPTDVIYSRACSHAALPTGITMATAIKAAWAWVLAQETGKTDVLFGQVTNCRGAQPEAGHDIIGMCLNITPVRVQLKPATRVCDLLAMIQQQHINSIEQETIDWADMVANSTSWPADTHLDSIVLHENFPTLDKIMLGTATGRVHEPIFMDSNMREHILMTFPGTDNLMTLLVTRSGLLENSFAENLVAKFNDTLARFLASPDDAIGPIG